MYIYMSLSRRQQCVCVNIRNIIFCSLPAVNYILDIVRFTVLHSNIPKVSSLGKKSSQNQNLSIWEQNFQIKMRFVKKLVEE